MAVAKWSTTVVSALSSDTEPTIVITFDNAKYIFNAGENTGRTWLQSRTYWRKVRALFFTQAGTQRMSGMPGLLMFLADGGISDLRLIGPQGLTHVLAALRLYAYRQHLSVTPVEVDSISPPTGPAKPKPSYSDENITVYSIPLFPEVDGDAHPLSESREGSPFKRKRTASSPSPPRRSGDKEFSAETKSLPLEDRMRLNGFLPTNLVGEDARQWRRMIVSNMFPGHPKPKRGRGEDPDADPPYVSTLRRHPGSFNPAGSDRQLPRMNLTKNYEPITSNQKPSLAYVVIGPKTRGKFDAKKADELGLKGKMRGLVASGSTVTFTAKDHNGKEVERIVKPEDCVGPGDNPAVVIILDIPTVAHIPAVVSAFTTTDFYAKFRSRRPEDRIEYLTNVAYHLCGPGVIEDARYQAFMRGFNSNVHHVVASRDHCPDRVTFTNASFNQLQFNRLDPKLFPIPQFSLEASRPLERFVDEFDFESGMGSAAPGLPPRTCAMVTGMNAGVRPFLPPKVWDSDERFHPAAKELAAMLEANAIKPAVGSPIPTHQIPHKKANAEELEFDKKILSPAAFKKFQEARAIVEASSQVKPSAYRRRVNGDNVNVIPLGTSSALPSKYRNVSGYLIRIPNHGSILLESGEGTWGQMCRFFGTDRGKPDNVWEVLRDIKAIFVSHAHGDHHFGLSKLLAMRKQLDPPPTEPLFLVTLYSIILGLKEFSDIEDLGFDYSLHRSGVVPIYSRSLVHTQPEDTRGESYQAMCKSLGLKTLTAVEVRHRTQAYGVVIDHEDGWRIVFSGDTQPTEALAQAGRGANLLIHEATMADDQAELAKAKAHSTVGQAVEIGKRMKAEKILLTHFSARYPKMPPQIVDQNSTPTSPLTTFFRSLSPSSSTSPISALPSVPAHPTTPSPSPPPTAATPESESKPREKKRKQPIIGLAFDYMNINLGEFWKLRAYLPAMDQAFGKDEKDEDEDEDSGDRAMIERMNG